MCCLLALLVLAGCTSPPIKSEKSLLLPAEMSPDAVAVDVFFARFPLGDPEVNDRLWQEVDEQHFPAELRKKLTQNGFRAGLVSGQIPMTLARLLELNDKPPPSGGASVVDVAQLADDPRVLRSHMPLRSGIRGEIVASEVYDQMTALVWQLGELGGQTYTQAQGLLAITAFPQSDGRVRLKLVPELHHDQPRQQWVGDQGVLRLEQSRPKRAFDDLGLSALLAPGDMLLLSSLPNRPGTLGHHFFTEEKSPPQQKLLVIRLVQTQHAGGFSPPQLLPLEE